MTDLLQPQVGRAMAPHTSNERARPEKTQNHCARSKILMDLSVTVMCIGMVPMLEWQSR
jgi:hypothetical protein